MTSGLRGANIDEEVVEGFGDEWSRFDQEAFAGDEFERTFAAYFRVFPWDDLPPDAVGFDLGCGSGRWARGVAPRVGRLHCIDASSAALAVARRNLAGEDNVEFHHASVDSIPLDRESMDFGYCLGVLHHVPDTEAGMREAVTQLKPGAPFLVYLYYSFDNQPAWYRYLWKGSDLLRAGVSRTPLPLRYALSQLIAGAVYYPLARTARVAEKLGANVHSFPLSMYRNLSFYVMRTDSLDRFGTRLEQRFSRAEIEAMMSRAGLTDIRFSEEPPYWCAAGIRGADRRTATPVHSRHHLLDQSATAVTPMASPV
jgi:ubiquinone/menaquinone biosynthesis C-methylase UbiE